MVILGFSLTLQINLTFRSVLCLLQNCLESMESPRVPIFTSTVSVSAHKTVQFIWHNHWHISVPPNSCPTLESGVSSLKFGSSTDMCPPLQCETEQVNSVSWAESLMQTLSGLLIQSRIAGCLMTWAFLTNAAHFYLVCPFFTGCLVLLQTHKLLTHVKHIGDL